MSGKNDAKILSLENEVEELRQELKTKSMEINALENKILELQDEIFNLPTHADNDALVAELERLKKHLEELKEDNESLRSFINSKEKQSLQDLEQIAILQSKLRQVKETGSNTFDFKGNLTLSSSSVTVHVCRLGRLPCRVVTHLFTFSKAREIQISTFYFRIATTKHHFSFRKPAS